MAPQTVLFPLKVTQFKEPSTLKHKNPYLKKKMDQLDNEEEVFTDPLELKIVQGLKSSVSQAITDKVNELNKLTATIIAANYSITVDPKQVQILASYIKIKAQEDPFAKKLLLEYLQ